MTKAIAAALIVLGVIGLAWGGFSYTTTEKAVDLGPIEMNKKTKRTIPVSPIAGAGALIGGIALLATAKNR
ncbi:hypothetical protein [Bryobacter aggregatus]|uniref:hypothetical protein n=1 Tax=Bryobacter aggregatus TaxID=360054 RepID=UPI0004E0D0A6|nr:hypothetical protein [Bryobacter aggregatus]